ncbi:MAG: flavodoxin family protein [Candidatus Odinarchaeia archaeon]
MKGLVVYESKYGNTKKVAEAIVDGMKKAVSVEVDLKTPKEIEAKIAAEYDFLLFGSPNHIGRATRGIRKIIEKIGKEVKTEKKVAVFDTYMGKDYMKAVKSMEKTIREKTENLMLIEQGLSIKVDGMKGPVSEGELPKCHAFGEKIAVKL